MPIKRRIRRILVAIKDPEARALPALAKAAQLARGLDAELVLFQAIDAPLYLEADVARRGGLKDIERRGRAASLARLERRARRLRRLGIRVSVSAEWDYPAYEAVVRAAGPAGVDLIVAERHAGRHFAAGLLHLTDWELLRLSPIPVLLVKRPGRYRRPVVLAAVDPDKRYAKPERLDREILQAGAQLADALRGTLHVVHAYSPLPLTAYTRGTLSEATLKARTPGAALRSARRASTSHRTSPARCDRASRRGNPQRPGRDGGSRALRPETPADRQYCRASVESPAVRSTGDQGGGLRREGTAAPPRGALREPPVWTAFLLTG
jgi:nucleotide-binding universal stress UspA family protein